MKQSTIYSPTKDLEKTIKIIENVFSDYSIDNQGDKLVISEKKFLSKNEIRFSFMTKNKDKEKFNQHIMGMHNFFEQINTENKDVQKKLLIQIKVLNLSIGIMSDKDMSEKTYNKIFEVAKEIDGFVFNPTGLYDYNNQLVLNTEGQSQVKDIKVTADNSLLDDHVKQSPLGEARKKRSEEILKSKNIPFVDHLPVIIGDEDVKIRSEEDIAKRAVALQMVAVKAEGLEKEILQKIINDFKASDFFTEKEKGFIENENPTEQERANFGWQYECYWVMLWALGYIENLDYPDHICDVPKAVGILKEAGSFENFLKKATLKKSEKILDEADLIYRYDWACVNARIKGEEAPGNLDSGVVVERHRALNWLINYMDQDWDNVSTDT
jgi:hypothetical protein